MNNTTTTKRTMSHLTAAGIAAIRETATKLGTQDPEVIRLALVPRMSPGHWSRLLASAGVLV